MFVCYIVNKKQISRQCKECLLKTQMPRTVCYLQLNQMFLTKGVNELCRPVPNPSPCANNDSATHNTYLICEILCAYVCVCVLLFWMRVCTYTYLSNKSAKGNKRQ